LPIGMAAQPKQILWRKMESDLRDCCNTDGVIGYSFLDLVTGQRSGYQDDVVFPTASTIKIAILLAIANKVHDGEISWEQRVNTENQPKVGGSGILTLLRYPVEMSLWDMCGLMIALSDNDATNICVDLAGMDYVNSLMDSLGLSSTRLRRKMMDTEAVKRGDENVSTPRELVNLMERIYRRDGVREQVAKDVLTLL